MKASTTRRGTGSTRLPKLFAESLLAWFAEQKRDLPWRRTQDPYAIWVSEVMLQQTRVEVVRDYFHRFLRRFPTLESLAEAPSEDVMQAWQGLGYYSRGRRLQEGARTVVSSGGALPESADELLKIPGIGPYTAGAIASIAFGERVPAVDGNVVRVLTRQFAIAGDPQKQPQKNTITKLAAELVPEGGAGDYNQALMELGATVCTPRKPLCELCPVREGCQARAQGAPTRYPELPVRKPPTEVTLVPLVVCSGRKVLLLEQAHTARWWAGLHILPTLEIGMGTAGALAGASLGLHVSLADFSESLEPFQAALSTQWGPAARGAQLAWLPEVRHQVTKHRLQMRPLLVELAHWPQFLVDSGVIWAGPEGLDLALAAPFRKILARHWGD